MSLPAVPRHGPPRTLPFGFCPLPLCSMLTVTTVSVRVASVCFCPDCRFCSSKLSAEEALRPSNGVRDVCAQSDCQSKSLVCCEKTLPCGCACNGIKNETTCLPCLKHDLNIDEDEYCGVSGTSDARRPAVCIGFFIFAGAGCGMRQWLTLALAVVVCTRFSAPVRSATWRV